MMDDNHDNASQSLRCGMVTLFGWTNVGKSTLLNQLVGTKLAAVADVAQTTRNRITGVFNQQGRGQIVFVDTPGLHRPQYRMNRAMIHLARQSLTDVDIVVHVVDGSHGFGRGDREAAEMLRKAGGDSVLVLNKVDLIRKKTKLLPLMEEGVQSLGYQHVLPLSALTGDGSDQLLDLLFEMLPEGPPLFDQEFLTDQSQRMLAAEWIREKLLGQTRQEVPHALAVVIETWDEREDGLLQIGATILVDRDSQKGIVIGAQGEQLKKVGIAARTELEALLGRHLFLELWVKVRRDWRNDRGTLRLIGLG